MNEKNENNSQKNIFFIFEKYHLLFLFLILVFAFVIRVSDLANDPPGMYMDEVSSAYNAYSILHTGKDEHGKTFPLFFEAFGEYRQGLYIYSMVPSLLVFGLTDFGTRFTSVLFGMGCIFLLYFLDSGLCRFSNIKSVLHSWNKSHLIMLCNSYYTCWISFQYFEDF